MKKSYLLTLFIIIVLVVLLSVVTYFVRKQSQEYVQNEALKTLFSNDENAKFVDLNNNPIELSKFADKVIVVNSWASWSPFTTIEFPILDELAQSYSDKGVKFLAVNRKEPPERVEAYLSTIPDYKNIEKVIDVNDFYYNSIDGYAMPETIIFDNKGKILEHYRGVVEKEKLESVLDEALKNNL